MIDARRGVLYPGRMPEFHRLLPPEDAAELIEWFWIPEWNVETGRSSRQHVVAYPALNLVIEPGGIELVGASTRATHRDLTASGWGVGALLRPAAVSALVDDPAALLDDAAVFEAPDLHRAVVQAMNEAGDHRREQAARVFAAWLVDRVGAIGPTARQANDMWKLLMTDDDVVRADDAAARMAISVRTLQRLAHRHIGLPPAAMIRRRRLQEAAQRVREDSDVDLSALAAELGYSDHAHLSNDFRSVLGITPRNYRAESA